MFPRRVRLRGGRGLGRVRIGPSLGTAIRAALGAAVILGLVLAPSTKRWLTGRGQPAGPGSPLAPGPVGTLDSSQPAPSGRTAITAAVMSLLGSVLFLAGSRSSSRSS
ncbi:MAG: hypothetical protein KDB70_08325 [Mycobacterium sp.]|nr:hypothetical protein [Mycobacterium sp.]